jgi:hypothetical protein
MARYPSRLAVESLDEYVARVWAREAELVAAESLPTDELVAFVAAREERLVREPFVAYTFLRS